MKTKVFKFQDGKRNESYIEEIKQIMRKNENVDTQASFDENGNYVVKVLIPDWRDKFRKDSLEAIQRKQRESKRETTYGNWQSAKNYKPNKNYNYGREER